MKDRWMLVWETNELETDPFLFFRVDKKKQVFWDPWMSRTGWRTRRCTYDAFVRHRSITFVRRKKNAGRKDTSRSASSLRDATFEFEGHDNGTRVRLVPPSHDT